MVEHALLLRVPMQCESCGMFRAPNNCSPCPSGKFSDTLSATACSICPHGHFSTPTLRCDDPRFAAELQWGGACRCTRCPPGKFQRTAGQRSCTACAAGRYAPRHAMSVCLACVAGRSGGAGRSSMCLRRSKPCALGHVSSGTAVAARCVPCAAGRFGADGLGCRACTPGRYQLAKGATRCAHCAAGRWSTEAGSWLGCSETYTLLRYHATLRGVAGLLPHELEVTLAMSLGLATPPPAPTVAAGMASYTQRVPATPRGGVRVAVGSDPGSMTVTLFVAPAQHHAVLHAFSRHSFARAVAAAYQLYAAEYDIGGLTSSGAAGAKVPLRTVASMRIGKLAPADSTTAALSAQEERSAAAAIDAGSSSSSVPLATIVNAVVIVAVALLMAITLKRMQRHNDMQWHAMALDDMATSARSNSRGLPSISGPGSSSFVRHPSRVSHSHRVNGLHGW